MSDTTQQEPCPKWHSTDPPSRRGKEIGTRRFSRSPSLIDLRVGHILSITKHPTADKLYVSVVSTGDSPGHKGTFQYKGQTCRTVCSGLNGLVPMQELQDRKVVIVCNVKPVGMCGIVSTAMFFAAVFESKKGEGKHHRCIVELVDPPHSSKAGDRVFFERWEGTPREEISTQKRVWKSIQPGFRTSDSLEVVFIPQDAGLDGPPAKLVTDKGAGCTVRSLKGAIVR